LARSMSIISPFDPSVAKLLRAFGVTDSSRVISFSLNIGVDGVTVDLSMYATQEHFDDAMVAVSARNLHLVSESGEEFDADAASEGDCLKELASLVKESVPSGVFAI
jgi:hypothetical protein